MNHIQRKLFDAAREAAFLRASELFAETTESRQDIVASMTDLLDQLDKIEEQFENRSGVADE